VFEQQDSQKYPPLSVDEVLHLLKERWGVTYDLKLLVREERLYLQMMWGYLEQQSFPMDEDEFRSHLNKILEIINRIGQSFLVREWLMRSSQRPRLGRAISLELKADERLKEFVL